jgi:arylsulfatase A-like enzyme
MKPGIFLSLVLAALSSVGAADAPKPNIVVFLIDDLGYADCGFNGGKDIQTPNIDKLARAGAVLESFYVQPVCSPTRAALLTGRQPTNTGVYTVVRPGAPWGLPLAERTLAQALKEAGYTTAISGKWHLGEFEDAYKPTRRGFDHQYGHMFGAIDYFSKQRDGKRDWSRNDQPSPDQGYATHLIAKEACRVVREKSADKPLFLYVPFNGIHSPHQVPESYEAPYKALPKLRRTIAGMLSAVDEAIGQIAQAIDDKGLTENTLIIFSADNGGPGPGKATMNTPLRAGKGTIYEGGIRASAFATWPGKIPAGTRVKEPLHIIDWYPTLLKLAGAPGGQKLLPDGIDIWPVLTDGAKVSRDALLLHGTRPGVAAVRKGDWKLLVNAPEKDDEEGVAREVSSQRTVELYHLAEDVGEANNLAASKPEKVSELRSRLDSLLKGAVAPGNPSVGPNRKRK